MQGGGGPEGHLLSDFELLKALKHEASSAMSFRLERTPE
jgi:hypothetical protein